MKYSIVTFGCRVNQADSLRLEEDLRARGGQEAASSDADLVIVNTCSVTATADQGARQTIRRIARENPHARIFATGCYATRCEDEVAALPNVVRVIRNDDKLSFLSPELKLRRMSALPELKLRPTSPPDLKVGPAETRGATTVDVGRSFSSGNGESGDGDVGRSFSSGNGESGDGDVGRSVSSGSGESGDADV